MPGLARSKWLTVVLVAVAAATAARAADPDPRLTEAQAFFDQARQRQQDSPSERAAAQDLYRKSAQAFGRLHEEGGLNSAKLFTNTGNAYLFAGEPGRAALYYRRALLLDPDEPRATAGLEQVRRELPWTRPANVSQELLARLFFWHGWLSWRTRKVLFLVVWPLAILLLGLARKKRAWLWAATPMVLAGVALLASLAVSANEAPPETQAVLVTAVEGHTGDGRSYSRSHSSPLPAGTELTILEARSVPEPWLHVRLPDRTQAWIPTAAAETLAPR